MLTSPRYIFQPAGGFVWHLEKMMKKLRVKGKCQLDTLLCIWEEWDTKPRRLLCREARCPPGRSVLGWVRAYWEYGVGITTGKWAMWETIKTNRGREITPMTSRTEAGIVSRTFTKTSWCQVLLGETGMVKTLRVVCSLRCYRLWRRVQCREIHNWGNIKLELSLAHQGNVLPDPEKPQRSGVKNWELSKGTHSGTHIFQRPIAVWPCWHHLQTRDYEVEVWLEDCTSLGWGVESLRRAHGDNPKASYHGVDSVCTEWVDDGNVDSFLRERNDLSHKVSKSVLCDSY